MHDAPRELDVTGCPVMGQGFSSTVYDLGDGTVAKAYHAGTPFDKVAHEFDLTRAATASGVPAVRAFEVVRVGDAYGIILEKLPSVSLGDAIRTHPDKISAYVEKYVTLAKTLHGTHTTDVTVPKVRELWLGYVDTLAAWCTVDECALVYDLVAAMPEADTLFHGDLHPGNIMVRDGELVLIDLAMLGQATYLADLACIYRGIVMGPKSPGIEQHERSMGMPAATIAEVGDRFFMGYTGIDDEGDLERYYDRLHPLYALSVVAMCGNGRLHDDRLARMIMDNLLRKVVIPQQDSIRAAWQERELTWA